MQQKYGDIAEIYDLPPEFDSESAYNASVHDIDRKIENLTNFITGEYREIVINLLRAWQPKPRGFSAINRAKEDVFTPLAYSLRPSQAQCNIAPSDKFLPLIIDELKLNHLSEGAIKGHWDDLLKNISPMLLVYMLALAVVRDERIKARKLLQLEPLLVFERCAQVVDYSGRHFNDRSPWELCVWTLNTWYMASIILEHLNTAEMRTKAIEQLNGMKNKGCYDPKHLFDVMRKYFQENGGANGLLSEIGQEQQLLPAHFARHLCNTSEAFSFQDYNNSNPNSFFNRLVINPCDRFRSDEPIQAYCWSLGEYIPFYSKDRPRVVVRSGMMRSWGGMGNSIAQFVDQARPGWILIDLVILSGIYEKRLADLTDIERQLQEPLSQQSCSIS
jgi:hypothetical protein